MTSTPFEGSTAPIDWRAEILDGVLRVVFAFGAVAGAISIGYSVHIGEVGVAVVDTAAVALVGVLAFAGGLSYRQRSVGFLLLLFGLGLFLLFEVGIAAHIYLLAFSVFTALLLGLRAGLASVAVTALTLLTLALTTETGPTATMGDLDATGSRLVVIANFVFVSAVLVSACATLLDRVERALEEQQRARLESQRLARAMEQSSDVILLADPSGRVEYANRAASLLVERVGEIAVFEHLDQLGSARAGGDSPTAVARRDGIWADTLVLADRASESDDAAHIEFDAAIDAVVGADGSVANLVGSLYDVTSTRQLERRLRRSEKLESLGTLASGVAHDFNNIVTGILGLAEGLRHELGDDPRARDVEHIIDACGRARAVVQQIMVFGQRSPIDQVPIVVADAVSDARPFLRSAIGADIEIRERLRSESAVRAHPGSITQALVNLVTNSAQAMNDAGGVVTIDVTDVTADDDLVTAHPTLRRGDRYVLLSVTDDGVGIDAAHLERIFDPFFTTKEPGEGTGLGLASVHAIVSAAGGEVGVTSEVGVGTTFRVWLPIAENATSPSSQATVATGDHRRGLNVLLVDDEPLIVSTLSRGLVRAGHVVESAGDGAEACERFDADPHRHDVVVTDLTMPGLGGIDLIRHVRARRPDIAVVLTSGFPHDRDDESLASLGLTAYLVKPFSHVDLLTILDDV
ncbi:MAG: hypothetical protein CL424_08765 [Acidimicrobiaceae bacterium]|nr:hypothetical protein [Acidimicrobiaceae bacterium]